MASSPASLLVERDAQSLTLTLDRPQKANALDAALVDALLEEVDGASADGTRLLVLRANGRHFCAGFDFSDIEEQSEGDLLLRFVRIEQLLQAIFHAPYATVALARGRAAGAGADLFAACSIRVAAADAGFAFPGAGFGIILGTRRLAHRVGADAARQWVATAETIDARRALALGLATAVVEAEGWADVVALHAVASRRLDLPTRESLHRMTTVDTRAGDMAALVASAARPGLKDRIRAYRDSRLPRQAAADGHFKAPR
jgi:enoyl-CoA hydratase/carnithine racemase